MCLLLLLIKLKHILLNKCILSISKKKKMTLRTIWYNIIISAVKRLITNNRIQNESFCLHNISVCTLYICYLYINIHKCMYIFYTNMLCLYMKYIYILYEYKFVYLNTCTYFQNTVYRLLYVCLYIYITHIYNVNNKQFLLGVINHD